MKPLKVFRDLEDAKVLLGQPIKLQCEISPGNVPGRWYRNGQLIQPNDRINIVHRNKYACPSFRTLVSPKNVFTPAMSNVAVALQGSSP